jgi:hypothetical protein
MAGTRTLEETVALANQGVHTMKSDASAAYTYAKDNPHNGWALDQTVLDFSPIRKAWADVYGTVFNKATGIPKVAEGELAKIEKVGELITKWEANPAGHTLGGLDDLKQAIRNTTHGLDETQVERVITAMANEVKGIAAKQSDVVYRGQPNNLYRESLKGYEKTMGELDEIQKSLGIGRSETSIDSAARKLTSVMRNNVNTNFGQRVKNVEKLEGAGSIDILPEIAGHALNTWAPRGIMRPLSGAGVIAGSKMILGLPFASPKLMGHAARGLGTVSGHMQPMLNDLDTILKAAQQIGAPGTGQLSNIGTGEYDYPTARARGGILRRLER